MQTVTSKTQELDSTTDKKEKFNHKKRKDGETMSDKEKIQSGFRVVNLSSYEMPTVKEVYNKDYICFGEDNAYFDRLVELSMVSCKTLL